MRTETPRKGIIIILDGLGDRPGAALDGKTPLEAARTPNLNALAGAGQWGLVEPVPDGHDAHTHLGVGLLFGLRPDEAASLSRGPIEAAGLGWKLDPGDLLMRANFATLETGSDGVRILDRRAGRIERGTDELSRVLQDLDLGDGVRATFKSTEQHRGVLRLAGPGLSDRISETDPGNVRLPASLPACRPLDGDAAAAHTAKLVNRFTAHAYDLLKDHPVNVARTRAGELPATGVICRGAGFMPGPLHTAANAGLRVAVVAGCSTVIGITRLLGFTAVRNPRFTADLHTDLDAKIGSALQTLADHDLAYVHVKAPDICAHDRQPLAKQALLERVDRAIAPLLDEDLVIGVCADHGTDSNTGWHVDDPVPGLLCERRPGEGDERPNFGEQACLHGPMGRLDGEQFLQRVVAAMGAKTG